MGRLALALISSLVLAWRPLEACLRGEMPLEVAVMRWAVGLVVAWVALGIISRLLHAYRAQSESGDEEEAGQQEAQPEAPRRRHEDGPITAS